MKRPAVLKESIPYISKMAIGNAGMEWRNSKKGTAFLSSTFSGKVKKISKSWKSQRNSGLQKSLKGRNDGRLMPGARRRTPYSSGRRPCRHRTHWAWRAIGDTGFLCSGLGKWFFRHCAYLPTPLPKGERAPIYFPAPHRKRGGKFKEKKGFPPLCLLAHPRLGQCYCVKASTKKELSFWMR